LEEYAALDGWLGCPTCGRPVNARIPTENAKRVLLLDLQRRLESEGLASERVLAVLGALDSEVEENLSGEVGATLPRVEYGP